MINNDGKEWPELTRPRGHEQDPDGNLLPVYEDMLEELFESQPSSRSSHVEQLSICTRNSRESLATLADALPQAEKQRDKDSGAAATNFAPP